MGGGDLHQRIEGCHTNEIGELAREFNRMAEHLELAQRALVAQSAKRLQLEREVQQAQKLVAVGMLAAHVAHEVGTPLNVIAGRAEALRRRLAPDHPDRRQLETIQNQAKVQTSWINPSGAYDEALRAFVARVLSPAPGNRFPADFAVFHEPIARLGMVNSLAQTVLKIAAPGVPDFYQGTELWDLSLVDPDNRRAVDWPARHAALDGLTARVRAGDLATLVRDAVESWPDGRVKLLVAVRALACRRTSPDLFAEGAYLPLPGGGLHADRLCAFARRHGGRAVVVVVPRLTAALTEQGVRLPLGAETWEDTAAVGPAELAGHYVDVVTGAEIRVGAAAGEARFMLATLLGDLPVAMLARNG